MRFIITLLAVGYLLTGSQGRNIQKRSDDADAVQAVLDQLSAQVTELQARLDAMDHHVAFSAQFSADHPTTEAASPFRFDQAIFNDGNAYNPALGVFTAPFAGVYTFSVQTFTYGPERPLVDIRVNGAITHRMAVDTTLLGSSANGEDSTSMTVTLKLAQADRVWVEAVSYQTVFWGNVHTFFTGALLYTV